MNVEIGESESNRFHTAPYVVSKETLEPVDNIELNFEANEGIIKHKMKMQNSIFEEFKVDGECKYVLHSSPFYIEGFLNEKLVFSMNQKQLLNYDFLQSYKNSLANVNDAATLSSLLPAWEQKASGKIIPCPKGPQSVALDFTFHELPKCYGLPERYRSFQLSPTIKEDGSSEPYRLFNLDQFDDSYVNQSLYGNVPFVIANSSKVNHNGAFLWLNASDTYVDFFNEGNDSQLHFISESGALEFFTFMGRNALEITSALGKVTGKSYMPQYFALGYHQCRWDKYTQHDTEFSNQMFEQEKIPCDCIWLDIEHTNEKRYFTWNNKTFPKPLEMIKKLEEKGRHLVVIVDPHLKTDPEYFAYKETIEKSTFYNNTRIIYTNS